MRHIVRLYLEHPLGEGQMVPLEREVAHRVFNVMRVSVGDEVRVFNAQDGEWSCRVAQAGKRGGLLRCEAFLRDPQPPADVWLVFAPIKKDRTEFIVEKATELGAARICLMRTEYTNAERVRLDKLQAHAVAAVEQCGGTVVPEIPDLVRFADLMAAWPEDRQIMFCDEAATGGVLPDLRGPWAIFVGPEGGFSEGERAQLRAIGHTVSLGPRILRADTAAVAALTLWQAQLGDWA